MKLFKSLLQDPLLVPVKLIKYIVDKETKSSTGKSNLLMGCVLIIPVLGLIYKDLFQTIVNLILSPFGRTLPDISNDVQLAIIVMVPFFFCLSIVIVGAVEAIVKSK